MLDVGGATLGDVTAGVHGRLQRLKPWLGIVGRTNPGKWGEGLHVQAVLWTCSHTGRDGKLNCKGFEGFPAHWSAAIPGILKIMQHPHASSIFSRGGHSLNSSCSRTTSVGTNCPKMFRTLFKVVKRLHSLKAWTLLVYIAENFPRRFDPKTASPRSKRPPRCEQLPRLCISQWCHPKRGLKSAAVGKHRAIPGI